MARGSVIAAHMLSLTLRHAAVTEFLAGQFAAIRVTAAVAALDVVACPAWLGDICAKLRSQEVRTSASPDKGSQCCATFLPGEHT